MLRVLHLLLFSFFDMFVGERNWVHLDIAGTGRSEVDAGENIKGGTGFGVRLLIEWLKQKIYYYLENGIYLIL